MKAEDSVTIDLAGKSSIADFSFDQCRFRVFIESSRNAFIFPRYVCEKRSSWNSSCHWRTMPR